MIAPSLNPQYRRDIVNGGTKPSVLRLPATVVNTFIQNEDSIYNYRADRFLTRRSIVEVQDNSNQYSGYNRRGASHSGSKYSSKKSRKSKGKSRKAKSVTIKPGQSLSEIARKNHTTVKKLRQLNGIKGSNIRAGKKLRVK